MIATDTALVAAAAGDARHHRLLLDPDTRVTCPHCEREFGLGEGFARRSLEALAQASEEALAGERQSIETELGRRLAREAAERQQRTEQELAALRQSLADKAGQVATLQAQELELRRERARLEEARQALELEAQRRIDAERRQIEERVRAGEAERARLREAELQKTIDDMRGRLEEAQRKGAQGSQQLQGEVLELLLEEQLAQAFPLDVIAEVKKGARGGDALQTVTSRAGQAAGAILWEAKRAQKWSAGWATKLREDMRAAGAEAGVIVTTSFPAEWPPGQPFGLHEHVWVTSPAAAIPLACALREGLLEAHRARVASANKGEKMEAVYDYLVSPQFALKLRAVYEAFTRMRAELDSERATTQQRWNRREKQIQLATAQLLGIAGDLQGLAQQDLPQLELARTALAAESDPSAAAGGVEEGVEAP
jgi:hypothetical protein